MGDINKPFSKLAPVALRGEVGPEQRQQLKGKKGRPGS